VQSVELIISTFKQFQALTQIETLRGKLHELFTDEALRIGDERINLVVVLETDTCPALFTFTTKDLQRSGVNELSGRAGNIYFKQTTQACNSLLCAEPGRGQLLIDLLFDPFVFVGFARAQSVQLAPDVFQLGNLLPQLCVSAVFGEKIHEKSYR
jgi:hypothetical protein